MKYNRLGVFSLACGAMAAFSAMGNAAAEELTEPLVVEVGQEKIMEGGSVNCSGDDDIAVTLKESASLLANGTDISGYVGIKSDSGASMQLIDTDIYGTARGLNVSASECVMQGGSLSGGSYGAVFSGSHISVTDATVTGGVYALALQSGSSLTLEGNASLIVDAQTNGQKAALYIRASSATLKGNSSVISSGAGACMGIIAVTGSELNIEENARITAPSGYELAIMMQPTLTYNLTEPPASLTEAVVNMKGGTIGDCGIAFQGNGNGHGTTVNISGGRVKAKDFVMYHPQYGQVNISGGELVGGVTGIEMRAGEINISGGILMSLATDFGSSGNLSGATGEGVALMLSQHTTNLPIEATITGGTLSGFYAIYEQDLQDDVARDTIKISISGGNFYGKIYSENCASFITGGNFNDASALAYLGANAAVNVKLAADHTETMPLAISDHSTVNLDMNGKSITGDITVEENSTLNFTALDILPALTASQSRMLRNVAANIINGALVVDGTSTVNIDTAITVKTVTLESGSTTNVDGSLVTADTPAVTITESTGSSIAEGAIINIKNLDISEGENLKLFSEEITQEDLLKAELRTNNVMQEVVASEEDGAVTIVAKNAADVLPDAELGNLVTEATKNNTDNAFLDDVLTSDAQAATKALNSVANMGEMAAVNRGACTMMGVMTDALSEHLSLTHGTEREYGKGVWANFISHNENVRGMQLAGMTADYDARYNGLVFGSDLRSGKKTTLGIGLTYAQGDIDSVGGHLLTRNDAEYYGLGLYGRSDNRFCSVLYDLSYMRADNDITQYNSGHVVTATAHSNNLSAGVKAEKALKTRAGTFLPYVGLRYMSVNTKDYGNNVGMRYDVDTQNIWTLPVGVAYSYEKAVKSWKLRAIADIGYVWAMGDTDTEQSVRLGNGVDSFSYDTMDEGSFVGRIRLEGEKGRTTIGAGYEYRKGDSVSADRWSIYINRAF